MHLDWANVSGVELWWTLPAVAAFVATLFMAVWAWRSFSAIQARVKLEPMRYRAWGPRWNFSLLLLGSMVCFGLGWLGYAGIGAIAMLTPPPVSPSNQTAASWLAWLLIGMEVTHALAQGLLWSALRALAGEPIVPSIRRQAVPT